MEMAGKSIFVELKYKWNFVTSIPIVSYLMGGARKETDTERETEKERKIVTVAAGCGVTGERTTISSVIVFKIGISSK